MFKKLFSDEKDHTNLRKLLRAFLSDIPESEFAAIVLKYAALLPNVLEVKCASSPSPKYQERDSNKY
jgi:hypothetical protein